MRISEEQLNVPAENGLLEAWAQQIPASTTIAAVGMTAPTTSGTASDLVASEGEYISYASALTVGSVAGWNTGTLTQLGYGPILRATVKTGTDITSQRLWIGLFSASPTGSDAPASTSYVAFRYATTTDTTAFWRVVTSNGSATGTTATTVAVAISTRYLLTIDASTPGIVRFFINGVLLSSQAANLPALTTTLSAYAMLSLTAALAAPRSLAIRKLLLEST